jgi:PAS domain-containing protein
VDISFSSSSSSSADGLQLRDTEDFMGVSRYLILRAFAQEKYVAALQESNTRYECVSLATSDVLWDQNLADDRVSCNENVCSLFGYQPTEVGAGRDWWISNVHPENCFDIASAHTEVKKATRNRVLFKNVRP